MVATHTWTEQETLEFIGFMEELVISRQRAYAGQFRPSSFEKLTNKMNEKFPGCGFTAKHCKSKHKRLKEKFQSATDMPVCSEFGWNEGKKCVEVDSRQVLELWLKQHPCQFYTLGKPFLLFPLLEVIFGRDKANRSYAVSGNDANEQVQAGDESQMGIHDVDMFDSSPQNVDSPLQASASMASSSDKIQGKCASSARKGKDVEILRQLAESVKYAMDQQGKHVQILAKAMAGVNDEVKVDNTLKNLGFTNNEVVPVALKFSNTFQLERNFWSLNDNQRCAFVRAILHN